MPTKEIPNPEIGNVDCPCCGAVVPMRINKNWCVYIFCNTKFENGERCFYRVSYGKKKSKEMIDSYSQSLSPETKNNELETSKTEEENDAGLHKDKDQPTRGTSANGTRKSIFRNIIDSLDD